MWAAFEELPCVLQESYKINKQGERKFQVQNFISSLSGAYEYSSEEIPLPVGRAIVCFLSLCL